MSVRGAASQLARLFEAANVPLYVVDQERKLVFCNEACAVWVGAPASELIGQRCDYHSSSDSAAEVRTAAALCPPPEAFAGETIRAELIPPAGDAPAKREAQFLPIGDDPETCVGVIGVIRDQPRADVREEISESWSAELHTMLAEACRSHSPHYGMERLVGHSPARRRIREQIQVAAASDASVLILGRRGTGRQHVARTIHELSGGETRLVPLDCAVAPTGLLEHLVSRASQNEHPASDRDILLLVDVDQLEPEAQSTLVSQLGEDNFPYRVIATATQPLGSLASQGHFREDLAFILSVVTIEVPRLAELGDDLPLLAQAFVEAENAQGGKQVSGFSDSSMEILLSYGWPGNVDELAEVVQTGHRAAGGLRIEPQDLPQRMRMAADAAIQGSPEETPIDLEAYLAEVELRLVRNALAEADGNKSHAAKMLGMNRQRLYRRLVQLGLE